MPPNVLSRFGLSDIRNYDSIELARSLDWLAPLYDEGEQAARSSRSEITWERVVRARDRLRESGVGAIVAASPPPAAAFARVERAGRVWIAWTDGVPWADAGRSQTRVEARSDHGWARIAIDAPADDELEIKETWDPGWTAQLDGSPIGLHRKHSVFLGVHVPAGRHELILKYEPVEFQIGLAISFCALVLLILVLTEVRLFWIPGITKGGGLDGFEPPG